MANCCTVCRLLSERRGACEACGGAVAALSDAVFRARLVALPERRVLPEPQTASGLVLQLVVGAAVACVWLGGALGLWFGLALPGVLLGDGNVVAASIVAIVWVVGFPQLWMWKRRKTERLSDRIRAAEGVGAFASAAGEPAVEGVAAAMKDHADAVGDGGACLATSFIVARGGGVLVRGTRAVEWAVVDDAGKRTIINGPLWVSGATTDVGVTREMQATLGIARGLVLEGELRECSVRAGTRVRVHGGRDTRGVVEGAAGYRDMPTVDVVCGRPGAPALVEVVD